MGEREPGRWMIRVLYALAIAGNLWILWEQVKDSPDGQVLAAELRKVRTRLLAAAQRPARERAAIGRMLWEAEQVIEHARSTTDD